jgi:hypothetical protein
MYTHTHTNQMTDRHTQPDDRQIDRHTQPDDRKTHNQMTDTHTNQMTDTHTTR